MSDHSHHNNSSGFMNGLILGALIGASAVFLLGTKKGREIVDEITDKGLSLVGDFEDLLGGLEEDVIGEQENPGLPTETTQTPVEQPDQTPLQNKESQEQLHTPKEPGLPKETTYIAVASAHKRVEEPGIMSANTTNPDLPSHIERLQAQGRRFFHGIPKRR